MKRRCFLLWGKVIFKFAEGEGIEGKGKRALTSREEEEQVKLSCSSGTKSDRKMESATTPPKESSVKRYKFAWRVLLISNLALGGYMFIRKKGLEDEKTEKKRQEDRKEAKRNKAASEVASTTKVASTEASIVLETSPLPPIMMPVKVLEPIPDDQQRELFQWMLEEKRKIKPKNREEKKQIDEDKAILKQFIRAESIPTF